MTTLTQYVVDAFTDKIFAGNPAAVCVMDRWLPDALMQKIAIENNLSETAFAVKMGDLYHLRWFTPGGEIELCGHATLATAYVVMRFVEHELREVRFTTLSGILVVTRKDDLFSLEFPTFLLREVEEADVLEAVEQAIVVKPAKIYMGADMVCVLESEERVRPDQALVHDLEGVCLHVTARAKAGEYDCITRSFAPKCGVAEDPVCGRGHCHVVSIWAKALGKSELTAYQASARGGVLYRRYEGKKTILSGRAALFSEANIHFDEEVA